MEFVVPGPGAIDGIRKCFLGAAGLSDADVIRFMAARQQAEFERLGLDFQDLWGRPLQLIDCQNLFCEVGKYARVAHPEIGGASGRTRIKRRFRPDTDPINYWHPPKWRINDAVARPPVRAVQGALFTIQAEKPMDFKTYQERAAKTDHKPENNAYYAGRFAGKEAVSKALGAGFSGDVTVYTIEILRLPTRAPSVKLTGGALGVAAALGVTGWQISISRTGGLAIASVIAVAD